MVLRELPEESSSDLEQWAMRHASSHWAYLSFLILLGASLALDDPRSGYGGKPVTSPSRFGADAPSELAAYSKQRAVDQRQLTIREANLFHRHFIDTCMKAMPIHTTLSYDGLVATDNGRLPLQLVSEEINVGDPLRWGVGGGDGFGLFEFWISTQRTKQTLAKCTLEGRQLFVNVDFVGFGHGIDDKLPALGGQSVREVLANIEKPLCTNPLKEQNRAESEARKRAKKTD